jgi:hypothetical protein
MSDPGSNGWVMQEAGWYTCGQNAGICREHDGLWHVYLDRTQPPGDAFYSTLDAAKAHVARRMSSRLVQEGAEDR